MVMATVTVMATGPAMVTVTVTATAMETAMETATVMETKNPTEAKSTRVLQRTAEPSAETRASSTAARMRALSTLA